MNTVEIVVLFEESRKLKELEELKKIEEQKKAEEKKIVSRIEQLKELEALVKEANEEIEILKDELKDEMMKRNTEEMKVGKYIVRWTEVLSNRFDTTAFKKLFPEVYQNFTKQSVSRRFSVSG